jgi:hypothetical protein
MYQFSRTSTHEFMNPLSNITNRTNISPVDIESSLDLQPSSSHHYNGPDVFVVDSQDLFVVDSQENFDEYQEISARNEKSTIENFETPKIPSSVKMSLASFGKISVDKKHIKSQVYFYKLIFFSTFANNHTWIFQSSEFVSKERGFLKGI